MKLLRLLSIGLICSFYAIHSQDDSFHHTPFFSILSQLVAQSQSDAAIWYLIENPNSPHIHYPHVPQQKIFTHDEIHLRYKQSEAFWLMPLTNKEREHFEERSFEQWREIAKKATDKKELFSMFKFYSLPHFQVFLQGDPASRPFIIEIEKRLNTDLTFKKAIGKLKLTDTIHRLAKQAAKTDASIQAAQARQKERVQLTAFKKEIEQARKATVIDIVNLEVASHQNNNPAIKAQKEQLIEQAARLKEREDALKDYLANNNQRITQSYILSSGATEIIKQNNIDPEQFKQCSGNVIQQVQYRQIVDLINKQAKIHEQHKDPFIQDSTKLIATIADAAIKNMENARESMALTDFGYALYDLGVLAVKTCIVIDQIPQGMLKALHPTNVYHSLKTLMQLPVYIGKEIVSGILATEMENRAIASTLSAMSIAERNAYFTERYRSKAQQIEAMANSISALTKSIAATSPIEIGDIIGQQIGETIILANVGKAVKAARNVVEVAIPTILKASANAGLAITDKLSNSFIKLSKALTEQQTFIDKGVPALVTLGTNMPITLLSEAESFGAQTTKKVVENAANATAKVEGAATKAGESISSTEKIVLEAESAVNAVEPIKQVGSIQIVETIENVFKLTESVGWNLSERGSIINGRYYTAHALERMAPDIPEVRAKLLERALKKYPVGTDKFQKAIQPPRNIPPSVVEETIRSASPISGEIPQTWDYISNEVKVVVNYQGHVITVHRI